MIYSYLTRKLIHILPPEQSIKNFSQCKTLRLLSRLAGTDCDISTKPRVLRAAQYNISILNEWRDQSDQKSAKFEISPVWSQMNSCLRYMVYNNYLQFLAYLLLSCMFLLNRN